RRSNPGEEVCSRPIMAGLCGERTSPHGNVCVFFLRAAGSDGAVRVQDGSSGLFTHRRGIVLLAAVWKFSGSANFACVSRGRDAAWFSLHPALALVQGVGGDCTGSPALVDWPHRASPAVAPVGATMPGAGYL